MPQRALRIHLRASTSLDPSHASVFADACKRARLYEVSLIHPSWYERQAAFLPSDKGVEVRGTVDAIRAQGMEMGVESLLCLRAFSDDGEEGFVDLSMRPMIAGA